MWITNGEIVDLAIIWAKDESQEVVGFIVDKSCPGFRTQAIEKKFNLRASVTSQLILEDCKVPATQVTSHRAKGPFSCLNVARYGIA